MDTILLQNHPFFFEIKRKPIRSLSLRLLSPNSFLISCPLLTPKFVITKFIQSHSVWIVKNSAKVISHPHLSSLDSVTILGQKYLIRLDPKIKTPHLDHSRLLIFLKHPRQLKKLLRSLALELIKKELITLRRTCSFSFRRLSVRDQKTRFGSCSSRGNLSFNWQIILFPPDKFRHILLHEITHLTHHNHSSGFWSALTLLDPSTPAHRLWLKHESGKYLIS